LAQQQPSGSFATVTQSVSFSGPLPHPSLLAKYNEVVPNGAERIIAMAESQSLHRQAIEARVVNSNTKSQERGGLYAFILCLVALLGGFGRIAFGKSVDGLVAIITALASLAGVFVFGSAPTSQRASRKTESAHVAKIQLDSQQRRVSGGRFQSIDNKNTNRILLT
jgi:uncharacterized membrane protein